MTSLHDWKLCPAHVTCLRTIPTKMSVLASVDRPPKMNHQSALLLFEIIEAQIPKRHATGFISGREHDDQNRALSSLSWSITMLCDMLFYLIIVAYTS